MGCPEGARLFAVTSTSGAVCGVVVEVFDVEFEVVLVVGTVARPLVQAVAVTVLAVRVPSNQKINDHPNRKLWKKLL